MKRKRLIITDLDNTLYDWVTYFSSSFYSMLGELSILLKVDQDSLIQEFKDVHTEYENTEQPFAVLEIPSVKKRFPGMDASQLYNMLDVPLHAFNKKRKETLKLYPDVELTLAELESRGITIIAHTESTVFNSLYRLNKLGIRKYFKHLYTLEGKKRPHPNSQGPKDNLELNDGFVIQLPKADSKPNPKLVKDICSRENINLSEVAYVGDSLTKDISMAVEAGVTSIWARYGKTYNTVDWDRLVRITHWTNNDVLRESILRDKYKNVKADFTIDSFSEILSIIS